MPAPGQIRDSNSTLIHAFFQTHCIGVTQLRLPEDFDRATAVVATHKAEIEAADLLLFSGGASVGQHDYTSRLLAQLGFTLRVGRTNLRPGRPLIVASQGTRIAFGLPGNPLAHFVGLQVLVHSAIAAFSGFTKPLTRYKGRLVAAVDAGAGPRETLWPAHVRLAGDSTEITLLPWQSSGDLTALATTNAIARIPVGTGILAIDSEVEFFLTDTLP
jgi:molybdopterin molybdotransferase